MRVDCSNNSFTTFQALIECLQGQGITVDHFHGVSQQFVAGEEWAGDPDLRAVLTDGKLCYFVEVVEHLNFFEDGLFPSTDPDRNLLGESPQGFHRLVADEWHRR